MDAEYSFLRGEEKDSFDQREEGDNVMFIDIPFMKDEFATFRASMANQAESLPIKKMIISHLKVPYLYINEDKSEHEQHL